MFLFAISPKEDGLCRQFWPDQSALAHFEIVYSPAAFIPAYFWIQF